MMSFLKQNPKSLAVAVILGGVMIAAGFLPIAEWVNAFASWMRDLGMAGALLFAAVFAVAAMLSLPASIFTAAAGLVYGFGNGFAVAYAGAFVASGLGFLMARYVFRERVEALANSHEKFGVIDRALGVQGWKIIGLLRLSPLMPLGLSTYLFGVTSVSFWPYVAASGVGLIPGTMLYAYLGAIGRISLNGGAHQRSSIEWMLIIGGLIATVAVTAIISRTARNALEHDGALTS